MKKKILSAILAMTMVMGLSISAHATTVGNAQGNTAPATGVSLSAESTTKLPVIKITVPTAAPIVINPYKLKYSNAEAGITNATDMVVSVKKELINESDVPVAVNVSDLKATPAAGKDITIMSKTATAATKKSAYIYLAIGEDVDVAKKFTTLAATNPTTGDGAKKDAIYTLPVGDTTATKCQFIVRGDVNPNPVDANGAADPWTAEDKVTVSYKFTFTPQIAPAS